MLWSLLAVTMHGFVYAAEGEACHRVGVGVEYGAGREVEALSQPTKPGV